MRFYRMLLRLYPSSYRAEYGRDLAEVFAARRAGETGLLAALMTIALAIADVVPNAIAVHWDLFSRDLRYAIRSLRRTPAFAFTAVIVVALGVGANAAAFSVAGFVLLRPLPFEKPEQLVRLWEVTPGYAQMELSPPNFLDWKKSARSFSDMGAYSDLAMNLTGSGEPRRLEVVLMTWNMPQVLGVHALIGRAFVGSDTVAGRSVLLSYPLWQTQFGGDRDVIGRRIDLDGDAYTVVGVMPEAFRFPTREAQLWTTLQFVGPDLQDRTNNMLGAVGRLRPGVTVDRARAELSIIASRLEQAYPKENEHTGATVYRMSDTLSERNRLLVFGLCGAAMCILLLACANLANLLLVRAVSREREIAVRTALGAGRDRLVRQLVTESAVLLAAGAGVGFVVAAGAIPALTRLVPLSLPVAAEPSLDWRTLLAATVAIAVIGIAFGVVPALSGSRSDALRDGARTSGGRKQRIRSVLVMVEVMASVVLLISSGLLMRAMWRLQSLDPGFRSEGVVTVRTALPWGPYEAPRKREAFYDHVLSGLRALPGVSDAGYITDLPMVMRGGIWPVTMRGQSTRTRNGATSASLRYATTHYFATMRIPLLRGRDIAETDDATRPWVAAVSESFAKRFWPTEDPMGKHFDFAFHDRMVVGIVGDVRVRGFEYPSEPQVYIPSQQVDSAFLLYYAPKDLVVRTSSPLSALLPDIRRLVREADPRQPISNIQTLNDVVAAETAPREAQLRVLEILAAIALVLATVGIYGLLAFTVSRRAQEIGVRIALGANPSGIRSMFLREGVLLGIGGILPGVAGAYAAGRGMQALLAGVAPADPLTIAVGVLLCGTATVVGCLRPAMKAARIDPIAALRSE